MGLLFRGNPQRSSYRAKKKNRLLIGWMARQQYRCVTTFCSLMKDKCGINHKHCLIIVHGFGIRRHS